jgi:nucleoside-diphosphate-sugar epimerase
VIVQLRDRRQVRVGTLSTCRDYVFVEDVASALAKLTDAASRHGVLTCNIGTGRAVTGSHVVATIAGLLGQEVEIIVDESRIRADDRPVLLSDCSTAHSELGWTATTPLEQGLRAAVERPVADEATFAH